MMTLKIARLFSGFDGAGEGIRDAGYDLSWAIEYDHKIAQVAINNGHRVIVADILDIDPASLDRPDGIHASPVCTNASQANSAAELNDDGTKETQLDRDTAMKTVQFVEVLRPRLFTLENVWQYRLFQSFQGGDRCEGIVPALKRLGYKIDYWCLNAADYGVPQTRKRLILVASLDFIPQKPWETHYNPAKPELGAPSFFGVRQPWVGWYEAIEDLIPELPESEFAPWQLARLPDELRGNLLIGGGNTNLADAQTSRRYDLEHEPAPTVMATSTPGKIRAFLVHGTNANGITTNREDEPAATVMATAHSKSAMPRAWLSQGRVVSMTPRALARLQTFKDTYQLSGRNGLDCKGIGNACPPLLFQKLYQSFPRQLCKP